MAMTITEDIRTISELKRETGTLLEQIHRTRRPIVLTVNGKAEAVLVDAGEFDKLTAALRMVQALSPAEEAFRDGRFSEASAVFKRLGK